MQLNEFYKDFDRENLCRHRFEIIIDHSQILLLHCDKFRCYFDDVIEMIIQRMLKN
jgi:hypothetical protein